MAIRYPVYPVLYKIEEECTTGWEVIWTDLTKEQCKERYDELIDNGVSPKRIKISRIS